MPTHESIERLRRRRLRERKVTDRVAKLDGKSRAITPDLFGDLAKEAGWDLAAESLTVSAEDLATEHQHFENAMTLAELEIFSDKTAVIIAQETRGRNKGCYPMVLNQLKMLHDGAFGLGFPGGRVRLGETPVARILKECPEETGLTCKVFNPDQPPVSEHLVGEDDHGHGFLAYAGLIVGGKPRPLQTKGEPILAIVFIDEETLERVCRLDGRITVKGFRDPVGVLRSHRMVFLEYLRKKGEVANVQI